MINTEIDISSIKNKHNRQFKYFVELLRDGKKTIKYSNNCYSTSTSVIFYDDPYSPNDQNTYYINDFIDLNSINWLYLDTPTLDYAKFFANESLSIDLLDDLFQILSNLIKTANDLENKLNDIQPPPPPLLPLPKHYSYSWYEIPANTEISKWLTDMSINQKEFVIAENNRALFKKEISYEEHEIIKTNANKPLNKFYTLVGT